MGVATLQFGGDVDHVAYCTLALFWRMRQKSSRLDERSWGSEPCC